VAATSGLVVSNTPQLAQNRDGLPLKTRGDGFFKDTWASGDGKITLSSGVGGGGAALGISPKAFDESLSSWDAVGCTNDCSKLAYKVDNHKSRHLVLGA
jgi:hypothetical protein